jgi:methionyl-tRNA formyltransferase
MRLVFMGTPTFAVPSLKALIHHYDVVSVITQPDRKAGRGRQIRYSPVKELALESNIPINQPETLRNASVVDSLEQLAPDLIIVAAYGKILPADILQIPKVACINVHASLLPRWRGAAPVEAAILAGDLQTGISIMQMDPGLDTGPVYHQAAINILDGETGGELTDRLAQLGASLLIDSLSGIIAQEIEAIPQDDARATYAPLLKKSDGQLQFDRSAEMLERQLFAYEPWPTSYFYWKNTRVVVRSGKAIEVTKQPPGICLIKNGNPAIMANPGALLLETIQPAGKKAMSGKDFLNGVKDFQNGRITYSPDPSR